MKLRFYAVALVVLVGGSSAANSKEIQTTDYKVHILEKGETLSELLHKENYTPLYGENQWVDKILKANHITMEQAKDLDERSPLVLPSKDFLLSESTTEKDIVAIRQSAISHGLFGNKISKHQNVSIGLQYHVNQLETGSTTVTSKENYGLLLGYEDLNERHWNGLVLDPRAQFGIMTHGTNTTNKGSEVISYDPTLNFSAQIGLKKLGSTFSFGPMAAWQSASRAFEENADIAIRRDHLLYAGGFISKDFYSANDIHFNLNADLLKSVFDQEASGQTTWTLPAQILSSKRILLAIILYLFFQV